MLKEAYKNQAELETSLNLAKSNLQLVQSNNEMLEEALKRDVRSAKDVGWRRTSRREPEHKDRSSEDAARHSDYAYIRAETSPSTAISPPMSGFGAMSLFSGSPTIPPTPSSGHDSGFFKFRFTNGSITRPVTPLSPVVNGHGHLTSPSLPSLPSQLNKELEELTAELERERAAHKAVIKEKADLEAEIESLSQALFEEVRTCLSIACLSITSLL
jgi:septal ring factor EnvC (AmiA/AmiB activator)